MEKKMAECSWCGGSGTVEWGPPFPVAQESLLDNFAGLAMQGMLVGRMARANLDDCVGWTEEMLAEDAYKQAEAMLAERERRMKPIKCSIDADLDTGEVKGGCEE